jgi:hypothetical protein
MKLIVIYALSLTISMILFTSIITKTLKSKKKSTYKSHKTNSHSKKLKQVHVVQDNNGFSSSINQVIRRNPTLSVETKFGAERLSQPSTILHMSNSNTSNGHNIGSFGKSVELVGMKFYLFIMFN